MKYTVSQDKNGYWYAHRVGYAYIPVFGSFSRNKRIAQEIAAGNMGLTYDEYIRYVNHSRKHKK